MWRKDVVKVPAPAVSEASEAWDRARPGAMLDCTRMRKDCRVYWMVSKRQRRRDFWPSVLEYIVSVEDSRVHRSIRTAKADVDLQRLECCLGLCPAQAGSRERLVSRRRVLVNIAYVLLIHLVVVCPTIRLVSVLMKERLER